MSWISVHEQVLGGKLRKLAKGIGCSQNEALGILVRLWLWGINNADKDGNIIGADKDDIAEVLTVGLDERFLPENVVQALIDNSWIDVENGLFLHDWKEWQAQWYKALAIREKDAQRKRKERACKKASEENTVEVVENTVVKKKDKESEYSEGFNLFWDAYPRKIGKGEAYKKYKARINNGWSPEELIQAAKNYAVKVIKNRTEKEYIKHPKTFLSDSEPFTDYLERTECKADTSDKDPYADWR